MTKLALRDIDLDDPSAGRRSTPHAFCAANDNHRPWWSRAQASGRPAQRLRGDGQTSTYHYDAEFGITSEAEPNGTVSYGYDAYGRRQTLTYPNGMVVTYGYDNANRMKTIATGGVTLGTYSYDPLKRQTQKIVPAAGVAGYTVNTQYDLLNRPLSVLYAATNTGVTYTMTMPGGC